MALNRTCFLLILKRGCDAPWNSSCTHLCTVIHTLPLHSSNEHKLGRASEAPWEHHIHDQTSSFAWPAKRMLLLGGHSPQPKHVSHASTLTSCPPATPSAAWSVAGHSLMEELAEDEAGSMAYPALVGSSITPSHHSAQVLDHRRDERQPVSCRQWTQRLLRQARHRCSMLLAPSSLPSELGQLLPGSWHSKPPAILPAVAYLLLP